MIRLPDPRRNPIFGLSTPAPPRESRGAVNGLPRPEVRPVTLPVPPVKSRPEDLERWKARAARREKWLDGRARPKGVLQRRTRPAPVDTGQYCQSLKTVAVSDRRLAPRAALLLEKLRELQSRSGFILTTYEALANSMNISRRHAINLLNDVIQCDYVKKTIRRAANGLHTGLVLVLTELALPAQEFEEWFKKHAAAWLAYSAKMLMRAGVKYRSPIKDKKIILGSTSTEIGIQNTC